MIIKKSKKVKNKQNKHSPNNDGQSESKKGIIQQHSNVPINISKTRFPIIEECCNELQYKIVESNSKALIFWCDVQKINKRKKLKLGHLLEKLILREILGD